MRPVVRVVPLPVVRVHRVRHVRRGHHRARVGPGARLHPAAARLDQPLQHRFQERPGRAGVRLGPGLLVVHRGQHRDRAGADALGRRGGHRGRAGVHRHEVVQPAADHELGLPAEIAGRLHVVGHQVPAEHVLGRQPVLGGHEGDQVALARVAEAPDRAQVLLRIELQALRVDAAVQVHGQLGDAQQRPVQVHQLLGAVPQHQPAGQAEVPVEPGVEQRPAVDLHRDLPPAERPGVGHRLDPQRRGVGVRTEDPERALGLGRLGQDPADQRPAAQHVVRPDGGVPGPGVGLLKPGEPGPLEPRGGLGRRVEGRGARLQERQQFVGVCLIESGRHGAEFNRPL